jgi:hypothetical protein
MMSTLEKEDIIRGDGSHTSKNVHRFIEQFLLSLQASDCLALMSLLTTFMSYTIVTTLIKPSSKKAGASRVKGWFK